MAKGDHKRKSRPIAPAVVTVDADSITVVVPDVLGKNASHVQSKNGGRRISEQTEVYRKSVIDGLGEARILGMVVSVMQMATEGAWRVEVIGVWPTQHGKITGRPVGFVCPVGDADAAIPQALDALQHAGILDDDARVVEVRAWNLYRKGQRATVIRLVRVPDLAARDGAVAHLAALVPAAADEAAAPAREPRRKRQ